MLGLSTRNYGKAVREFADAYSIEKSAVSDHFIRVSRRKLRELMERPLGELSLCAIYIDGVEYHSQHLIVALGLAADGRKIVLGMSQGATENALVAGELLGDLDERGVDFTQLHPTVYTQLGLDKWVPAVPLLKHNVKHLRLWGRRQALEWPVRACWEQAGIRGLSRLF